MTARQVTVKASEIPEGWKPEAADFVNQVRKSMLTQRSVSNGPRQIGSVSMVRLR